jgi:hypothetical protein
MITSTSYAILPDGWAMTRVDLDASGRDVFGWVWGPGEPLWYVTDGAESLTIRAPSPVAAIALVMTEAWPPKLLRRYNWEYASP